MESKPLEATTFEADESDLVLRGYVAFLDPPKPTCLAAIADLQRHGIVVKVITGGVIKPGDEIKTV